MLFETAYSNLQVRSSLNEIHAKVVLRGGGVKYEKSIERFSFECRKTKTKVITLTNHNSRKQSNEEANTCRPCQTRENACRQVAIGLGFTSDWSRKWHEIFLANHKP